MAMLCWSGHEEIPHDQGKRNPSKMVGVARGHQRAVTLKPYSQTLSFLGLQITAEADCSHEIKRRLSLGGKDITNLDSIKEHFANKGPSSQSYGFSSSHV